MIKNIFVYYCCLSELLLSFSPPRSLLHPCHCPRGTSIKWICWYFDIWITKQLFQIGSCVPSCCMGCGCVLFRGFLVFFFSSYACCVLACVEIVVLVSGVEAVVEDSHLQSYTNLHTRYKKLWRRTYKLFVFQYTIWRSNSISIIVFLTCFICECNFNLLC
jgi:hypothetical protein